MEVITYNHYENILDLFDQTQKHIKIISPFISVPMAKKLCNVMIDSDIKCQFITRFYLEDMFAKANSMDAIAMMINTGIEVYALKGLHTKLYLFDDNAGVLGSANFTAGGFKSNIELSLMLKNEDNILPELHKYFDSLLEDILKSEEGLITLKVLNKGREKYKYLLNSKKDKGNNYSTFMYGASIDKKSKFDTPDAIVKELDWCKHDQDIVDEVFKSTEEREQILLSNTIWLKFGGEANRRLNAEQGYPITVVEDNGKKLYLSNYPFKVHSIKRGDEIYLAALSTDTKGKNQPVIVGRGKLLKFTEDNYVSDDRWLKQYDWMDRYPWYCVIESCKILDTSIQNGIPLDEVWDELGSDTYMSSFGKKEQLVDIARKHHQKAHIRLSGNAKAYIDKRLDMLEEKYGAMEYISDMGSKEEYIMGSITAGYVNDNEQKNLGRLDERGTDNKQYFYQMKCLKCGYKYKANGSDIWLRKCPQCQGGRP